MKMSDYRTMVETDLLIDMTDLANESSRNAQLHGKYLAFLSNERLIAKHKRAEFNVFWKSKWEYYAGKMDKETLDRYGWEPFPHKIMKPDIETYMNGDSELNQKLMELEIQEEKVRYLEQVMKYINNRNWDIRNAIDFMKFTQGAL